MTVIRNSLTLLAVWLLTHFLLVAAIFFPEVHWRNPIWDVRLYYHYANLVFDGWIPYKDFSLEYPPLALPFFLLPRLFSQDFNTYLKVYNLEVLAIEFGTLVVIAKMSSRDPINDERQVYPLYAYLLLMSSSGQIFLNRYDAVPAFLVALWIYLYVRGQKEAAWFILACSVMTKIYPVILAPLFLLTYFRRGDWRVKESLVGVLLFLSSVVLISAPFLLLGGEQLLEAFLYHWERGIQLESTYASLLLLLHLTSGLPVVVRPFRAVEVFSPISSLLSWLALPITLISELGIYLAFARCRDRSKDGHPRQEDDASRLIRFSLLSTLAFLLSYKVFSPQFLVWLFPLAALLEGPSENAEKNMTAFLIVVAGLTQTIYPLAYKQLAAISPLVTFVLLVRNLLLIACFFLILNWERGPGPLSKLNARFFMIGGMILLLTGFTAFLLCGWRPVSFSNIPISHPGILLTIGLNLVLCSGIQPDRRSCQSQPVSS